MPSGITLIPLIRMFYSYQEWLFCTICTGEINLMAENSKEICHQVIKDAVPTRKMSIMSAGVDAIAPFRSAVSNDTLALSK
ncbi:MAG: hypothetical protein LBN41_04475 [Enterobacteriaceae bacterium]|jgi:hypothetical protein|nr:hypothetical protein [Enterobacteriaceae bacterium]